MCATGPDDAADDVDAEMSVADYMINPFAALPVESDDDDDDDPGEDPEVRELLENFHISRMCRELVELNTHGTAKTAIESVMKIVESHMGSMLPDDLKLPKTWHMITKAAGEVPCTHEQMIICPAQGCNLVHASAVPGSICANCDTELVTHRGDPHMTMLEGSLVSHLERLWKQPRLAALMDYPRVRETGDGDVWDAGALRGIDADKCTNTMCLSVCTDGSVLKRYRNDSYVPFIVRILNLPPYVLTKSSALVLWAMLPPKVHLHPCSYSS